MAKFLFSGRSGVGRGAAGALDSNLRPRLWSVTPGPRTVVTWQRGRPHVAAGRPHYPYIPWGSRKAGAGRGGEGMADGDGSREDLPTASGCNTSSGSISATPPTSSLLLLSFDPSPLLIFLLSLHPTPVSPSSSSSSMLSSSYSFSMVPSHLALQEWASSPPGDPAPLR